MDELEEFKVEILELLERAEKALLEFEGLPDGATAPALYDEVFRAYHNIKGAAGMMDWQELQHHVHQLENVLMQSKESQSIPRQRIGWFLRGNDATRQIIDGQQASFDYEIPGEAIAVAKPEPALPDFDAHSSETTSAPQVEVNAEFKAEVEEALERISQALLLLEAGKAAEGLVDELYRDIHSLKGAAQLFGYALTGQLTHAMESSLEPVRAGKTSELDPAHVSTLLLCLDLVPQSLQLERQKEMEKEVSFMVKLLAPFGPLTAEASAPTPQPQTPVTKVEHMASKEKEGPEAPVHKEAPEKASEKVEAADKSDKVDSTIRVQVSLLDRLMTLMGEMVLVRNQVLQYTHRTDDLEFLNLSQKLDVVTSELQEETMKTRMQPIGNILTKFQRVVRDLSGSLDKKIGLNLIGVETELDKSLIEAVKDPLTHIVRNSCDHGIEKPAERKAAGKPENGTVTIKAYHEGGQVIVDISDDGRGLSREKLLKKAIERGLVQAENAARLSDREVHGLIFAPGFSTAEKVTNVSGRGVGMDVVKSNIERIGGLVDIASQEGKGTKITLKIPLTLAIVPAMVVRSGDDRYAIPQVKLVELVRAEPTEVERVQGRAIYRLRGNILPLVTLKEVLLLDEQPRDEAMNIVVLNSDGHIFGLVVDEILDTADIVVKPLARFLKPISIYSGATVLGDGSVAFILDVMGICHKYLCDLARSESNSLYAKEAQSAEVALQPREYVLVGMGSGAKHAIPLTTVSRMEEFKTTQIERSGDERLIRYRGGVLKIISLNEVLGQARAADREITQIIVVRTDSYTYGLEVDQIIDVLSTIDPLDQSLETRDVVIGNLVTSSEIIVVVDVERIYEAQIGRQGLSLRDAHRKVLVVEDTESIRSKLVEELTGEGYQVIAAVDGIEGLRQIAQHKCQFDVIISDIEMPRLNGYDFARKVRSIERMRNIPLIAFTTKNSQEDLRSAKAAGFSTFLEKSKGKLLSLLVSECLTETKRKIA